MGRFSLTLAKKYDLSQVGRVIAGGDGAPWVKNVAEFLGGMPIYPDRFYVRRALNQTLCNGFAMEMYQACTKGEIDKVDRILIQAQQKTRVKGAKEVARLGGYLMEKSFGLRDYRLEVGGDGLRGLGAIEDNVNKLVANRWSWRFILMVIRDSHHPIVDSNFWKEELVLESLQCYPSEFIS